MSTDREAASASSGPASSGTAPSQEPDGGYQRVLLKLSGEVFGGGAVGLDLDVVSDIARQVRPATHDVFAPDLGAARKAN